MDEIFLDELLGGDKSICNNDGIYAMDFATNAGKCNCAVRFVWLGHFRNLKLQTDLVRTEVEISTVRLPFSLYANICQLNCLHRSS